MYCPKCGAENASDEIKYCSKCGMNLTLVRASIKGDAEKAIALLSQPIVPRFELIIATILGTPLLFLLLSHYANNKGDVTGTIFFGLFVIVLIFLILPATDSYDRRRKASKVLPLDEYKKALYSSPKLQEKDIAKLPPSKTQPIAAAYFSVTEEPTEPLGESSCAGHSPNNLSH
jgi:hypothetical protein